VYTTALPLFAYNVAFTGVISILAAEGLPITISLSVSALTFSVSNSISIVRPFAKLNPENGE
jgi:hypothetical protein